jgi:methanogenic corrinoid protein MtbC1
MRPDTEARIQQLEQALLSLDRVGVEKLLAGPAGQLSPLQELEDLVVPALERIGQGWEEGRVALSQVYMSGRLCEELVDALLPASPGRIAHPPMAIAVLEDYHFLGMRLVYSVLRASGFELYNYGRQDVTSLVSRVRADGIEILLISVLMLR